MDILTNPNPLSKSKKNKKFFVCINYFILLLSLAGVILTLTEIYLNLKGSSICKTEGCNIVHLFDVYHVLNYLGIFIFLSVFLISLLRSNKFLLVIRSFILSTCMIVEGYFIGFQLWYVKEICHFCLTIATFVFILFVLDFLFSKYKTIGLTGIIGFLSLIIATYLVNIPLKPINTKYPVVLYQKNCPHCKHVIKYARDHQIKINTYEVEKLYPLMKILNINTVPVLIYKEKNKISIISGENEIKNWFNLKYFSNSSEILSPYEEGGACRIDQLNCN